MRTRILGGLVAALLLAAPLGLAANNSATGNLDNLYDEVVSLDNALSGDLDKAQKKEKKSLGKVLKAFDKGSDDLAGDLKLAGKVVKTLEKTYKDEFFGGPEAASDLPGLVNGALSDLRSDLDDLLAELGDSLAGLSTKGQSKVEKALAKAQSALEKGETGSSLSGLAKAYFKALKAWSKGQKTVDKDKGPDSGFSATFNGKTKKAKTFDGTVWNSVSGVLNVAAQDINLGGFNITLTPSGQVDGPGQFGITAGFFTVVALPPDTYSIESGTITITTFDTENGRVIGSFDATFTGAKGEISVSGTFNVPMVIS